MNTAVIVLYIFLFLSMCVSATGIWLARDGSKDSRGTVLCTMSYVVLALAALLATLCYTLPASSSIFSLNIIKLIDYLRALLMPSAAALFYLGLRVHVERPKDDIPREKLLFSAIFATVSYGFFTSQPEGWPTIIVNFWIGVSALLCLRLIVDTRRLATADKFMAGALALLLMFSWLQVIWGFSDLHRDPTTSIDVLLLVGATNCTLAIAIALIVRINHRVVERLRNQAATDSLTGALTRRAFSEQGEFAISMCRRQKLPCTVAYIDIDNFKRLNDDFGHRIGDRVLYSFAEELKSAIRSIDVLGRLGGDEFVIIFPSATVAEVKRCVDRVRDQLDRNVTTEFLQFSCGIADALAADLELDEAVSRADQALYEAKKSGRHCNFVWGAKGA
ncbi:GGDEF domain-containing protein [uncultured Umboniibacter sp.]|uniref:GGDEF domain-containing protein n=1 Tax=uncultured Umboniibacter sp. TaxID=1798917 RepID=UPI002610CE37|nr:GGDEF domain-containing protein [uncultured Umboniibacter sp.]